MVQRTIRPEITGPTGLHLQMLAGKIEIIVEPDRDTPLLVLKTDAESGPLADAVRDTTWTVHGNRLSVCVPDVPGMSGNQGTQVVTGNGSVHISHGGGRVFVNGVEVTSSGEASSGIKAVCFLPAGSSAAALTGSSETRVTGELDHLNYEASSGSLTAGYVGFVHAVFTSGSLEVREAEFFDAAFTSGRARVSKVSQELDLSFTRGTASVTGYSGDAARIKLTSGSLSLEAEPEASGTADVRVTSGSAHITKNGSDMYVFRTVTSGQIRVR